MSQSESYVTLRGGPAGRASSPSHRLTPIEMDEQILRHHRERKNLSDWLSLVRFRNIERGTQHGHDCLDLHHGQLAPRAVTGTHSKGNECLRIVGAGQRWSGFQPAFRAEVGGRRK